MMEIKFRIWDDKGIKDPMINDAKPGAMLFSEMEIFRQHPASITFWVDTYAEDVSLSKDLAFEMFTGLKDRYGKEIYEGDIVKHRKNNSATAKVEYVNDGFYAVYITLPKEGEYGKHLYGFEYRNRIGLYEYIANDATIKAEIIGNIHENPELLITT